MTKLTKIISLFLLSFSLISNVEARLSHESEASVECIKNETNFAINADGTYKVVVEEQLKILNETGRQNYSVRRLNFDKVFSNFKVLEAKTILDNKEYKLQDSQIEIKPLASDPTGLSETYQVLIPFENAVVGSVIHLKYEHEVHKTQVPNFFEVFLYYANGYLWKNSEINITSAMPITVKLHDPKNILSLNKKTGEGNEFYQIRLLKPTLEAIVQEPDNNSLEPQKQTYLSLSSDNDNHLRIAQYCGVKYDEVLKEPLPPQLGKIVSKAKAIKGEKEQITSIIADLIGTIHYLGTWRGDGCLFPRSLATIVNSGYGDCKEYSTCLVAILRALGYEANIVFVNRGEFYLTNPAHLPLTEYNHVIVRAKGRGGESIWLDPTNITAMAEGIHPDVAGRVSLILHPEKPSHETVPSIDHRHSVLVRKEEITFSGPDKSTTKGTLSWTGEIALPIKNKLVLETESIIKGWLSQNLAETGEPYNEEITIKNHDKKATPNIDVSFKFDEDRTLQLTNLGVAIPLMSNWATPYLKTSPNHDGAIYVGIPETLNYVGTFKGVTAENIESLAFTIKSPWVNAKRELKQTKEGIQIISKVEILKSIITPEEIKSAEFESLKKTLRKYCSGVSLVVKMKAN